MQLAIGNRQSPIDCVRFTFKAVNQKEVRETVPKPKHYVESRYRRLPQHRQDPLFNAVTAQLISDRELRFLSQQANGGVVTSPIATGAHSKIARRSHCSRFVNFSTFPACARLIKRCRARNRFLRAFVKPTRGSGGAAAFEDETSSTSMAPSMPADIEHIQSSWRG